MGGNPKVGGFSNLEYYRRDQRIGDLMPYGTCGVIFIFAYHARVSYPQSRLSLLPRCRFSVENHGGRIFCSCWPRSVSLRTIWVTVRPLDLGPNATPLLDQKRFTRFGIPNHKNIKIKECPPVPPSHKQSEWTRHCWASLRRLLRRPRRGPESLVWICEGWEEWRRSFLSNRGRLTRWCLPWCSARSATLRQP